MTVYIQKKQFQTPLKVTWSPTAVDHLYHYYVGIGVYCKDSSIKINNTICILMYIWIYNETNNIQNIIQLTSLKCAAAAVRYTFSVIYRCYSRHTYTLHKNYFPTWRCCTKTSPVTFCEIKIKDGLLSMVKFWSRERDDKKNEKISADCRVSPWFRPARLQGSQHSSSHWLATLVSATGSVHRGLSVHAHTHRTALTLFLT